MQSIFSGADSFAGAQIAAAPLLTDPFEHCVVDDVLPDQLFQAIHDNWPGDDVMVSLPDTGRVNTYKERFVMLMNVEFLGKLSEDQKFFWISVMKIVAGSEVVTALVRKFQDILIPRIEHLPEDTNLNPEMLVVSDHSNYSITPHTDTKFRFISMLYYLSPDPKYISYGTSLYVPKDPNVRFSHNGHFPNSYFDHHSRIDYKPNRLVAFPRSDRSFHGVEPVPVANCDRRLIIVNVRAPEGAK